ncbi:MAG TPA: VOC family protein [Actinomycetota bacterium]|nr:VOC family protein [Actinomycetota bacterium]
MPEISKHVETMYSYADLATTDLRGAIDFYTGLFGWDVDEVPLGESGQVYAIFKKNGKTTAAAADQQPQQREAGVPPMWNTYFTVYDVDNRTKEAERAGGTIHAGPFDVFDNGRMSVIQDPNGAFFSIWQPATSIGAEVMHEHGALTWTESVQTDIEKGRAFYGELFGWDFDSMGMGDGKTYTVCKKDDVNVCGLMEPLGPDMPSFWLNYFAVDDCGAAVAAARDLGAQIMRDATPIPGVGTFGLINDPQGAGFGVLQGEPAS